MQLIFEISEKGIKNDIVPQCDTAQYSLPQQFLRTDAPLLPEVSEVDLSRHYCALSKRSFGVCDGFYPLGSCTMKYNPKIDEETSALFAKIHPLQPKESATGCYELMDNAKEMLCSVTGMDSMTFQPAAGAHGELCGLMLIKKYHEAHGNSQRNKIIVPDSAHGTNPASAAMLGFTIINIASDENGYVDLAHLREAAGDDTAGIMLTNPNTLGLFDPNIEKITEIVHSAGGLCYYDGANLNAVMGIVRPGDMGFDCVHLNLHKTFATPHGGGGPGAGAVGCKDFLSDYLPLSGSENSVGRIKAFYGNFGVLVKAYTYMLSLGGSGLREAAENAVLNANYFKHRLCEKYTPANKGLCMHEFVLTLSALKEKYGVSALDIAKGLLERGIHPPTMYFPLIVHEALMPEPTETESLKTLDSAADAFLAVYDQACQNPQSLHDAPQNTVVSRPDEVIAARKPVLKYEF